MENQKNNKKPKWAGAAIWFVVLALVVVGGLAAYRALAKTEAPPAPGLEAETGEETNGGEAGAFMFTVYNEEENEVALESFRGGPVVVNFWATWCSYCKVEMPYFQTAYEKYGEEIAFMFINADESIEVAAAYTEAERYTFPVYYDFAASARSAAGIRGLPTTLFIDSRGEIFSSKVGMIDEESLQQYIDDLLEHEKSL